MELWLDTVEKPANMPAPAPVCFDAAGGSIGRQPDCHLFLDDAERQVSRQHAAISAGPQGFRLDVLSEINPVRVNAQVLRHGEQSLLADGDEIQIGAYVFRVRICAASNTEQATNHEFWQRALQQLSLGLGYPMKAASAAEAEQKLRETGELLAELLDGTRRLLALRDQLKGELTPTQRTVMMKTDNNPLKLASSRQELLNYLFNPELAAVGLKAPVAAAREAMNDLRVHDEALRAGSRQAVCGVLQELDPETISRDTPAGISALLLPGLRQQQRWTAMTQKHQQLKSTVAQSGSAIQEAFREGYQEYVKKAQKKNA